MSNHGTDQKRKTTPKQLTQLSSFFGGKTAKIVRRFYRRATFEEVQAVLQNKKNTSRTFEKLLEPMFVCADSYSAQRAYWKRIYHEHLGLEADFNAVVISPKPTDGKRRPIFIPQGLKMNHAADCYRKVIVAHDSTWEFWKYANDLDAAVTINTRTSAQAYCVWVRDEVEPDTAYLGQSTRKADMDGKIGVTLLERLVHGLVHFVETKKHLDERGVTLCTGSRNAGGSVPGMYADFAHRRVDVVWYYVDSSSPQCGLRSAV